MTLLLWYNDCTLLIGGYLMNLFILRWNPNISSFTMEDFEKLVRHTDKNEYPLNFDWSIYEWQNAHSGDLFILQQVGTENDGFVAAGKLTSEPYEDDSWRKNGTKVHYADLALFTVYNRTKHKNLSADVYEKLFSFTKWHGGHSGELITGEKAESILKQISSDLIKEKIWNESTLDYFINDFTRLVWLDEE